MPQRTQQCLVHVLLLWITALSITQVLCIILYFTVGRQFSPDRDQGKGKMITFHATEDNEWKAKNEDLDLVKGGDKLKVMQDGYYFLSLQVTLDSCEAGQTLTLKWNGKALLKGLINTTECSTGLLSKVEQLSGGGFLEVAINPKPKSGIDTSESATHLDIIYMP